jgi:hypothetical protein
MLVIAYHLLGQGTCDDDQRYADQRPKQEACERKRAIQALARLGSSVTVERVASSLGPSSEVGTVATRPIMACVE